MKLVYGLITSIVMNKIYFCLFPEIMWVIISQNNHLRCQVKIQHYCWFWSTKTIVHVRMSFWIIVINKFCNLIISTMLFCNYVVWYMMQGTILFVWKKNLMPQMKWIKNVFIEMDVISNEVRWLWTSFHETKMIHCILETHFVMIITLGLWPKLG